MSIKGWVKKQVGGNEGRGRAEDSFPDTIVSTDNPMRRRSGHHSTGERRTQQQPQMGDDKLQKQRGRVGDYR